MERDADFSVSRRREQDAAVVVPTGEIDLATVDAVRDELTHARADARRVVLDLRGVSFMDSSGLRLLVELQRASAADGFTFAVVRGPRSLQRLLELSGLEGRVRMVDDPGEAVARDG
jgi:anti-sigma B factor antagonist